MGLEVRARFSQQLPAPRISPWDGTGERKRRRWRKERWGQGAQRRCEGQAIGDGDPALPLGRAGEPPLAKPPVSGEQPLSSLLS